METTGAERTKGGIELGLSVLQRQLSPSTPLVSPDSFYNPSFHRITDETLACVSTVLEDTMDPSLIANEMGPTANVYDAQMKKTTNEDTVISGCRSQMKTNSLLCIPEENSHAEDFSMSFISSQNNTEELTQTDLKGDPHDPSSPLPESSICNEKCYMRVESNSTFDLVKEGSMGSNSTKALNCKGVETNITFEKSQELKERYSSDPNSTVSTNNDSLQGEREKHLNSIDIYCPSNVTTEQHNEKLDSTVDIIHSSVCKQEQCNEGLTSVEDCEKHGTFTKEVNVSIDVTGVVEKNGIASHVSTELGEPCNVHAPDRAFNKHNTMADLTHPSPLPTLKNSNINTTEDVLKTSNIELPPQSSVDVATTVGDALLSGPSDTISTAAVPTVNVEVAVCCNRTLDLPGAENKGEDQQGHFQRRTGVSDGECHLNLNISQSSCFSLDDTLDIKSHALVTSTPIVLGRGFYRLGSAKLTNMQKAHSVINSIDTQSTNDLVGISDCDGLDKSETSPSSMKSDTQKVSAKCSSISKSAAVNKPPSKLSVRRKIPQPAFKCNIPKTQIPVKSQTSQGTSVLVNLKGVPATQALNQPETSISSLHSLRRTVELNKRKNFGPAKTTTKTATARPQLSVMTSSSRCSGFTADSKPSNSSMTKPKLSSLLPTGQRRLGLKPPGSASFSVEAGHSQTNSKPSVLTGIRTRSSLLPGFAQKQASSGDLPLAKRKKN
uniref:Uncharacterized protein n=2 Tax=Electrophorus electricus TaxID=8005 RepID=A0A4W4H033_ELEEL